MDAESRGWRSRRRWGHNRELSVGRCGIDGKGEYRIGVSWSSVKTSDSRGWHRKFARQRERAEFICPKRVCFCKAQFKTRPWHSIVAHT